MNRFGDDFLVLMNVWNWEDNVIFNTSIYYKYSVLIDKRIFIGII